MMDFRKGKKLKQIERKTRSIGAMPIAVKSDNKKSVRIINCVNLRRREVGKGLEAVGDASLLLKNTLLPFFTFINREDEIGLFYLNGKLYYAVLTAELPAMTLICEPDGAPLDAVTIGEGRVEVMTESGREMLVFGQDNKCRIVDSSNFGKVRFSTDAPMTLGAQVDSFALNGSYSRVSGTLNNADAATLGKKMVEAYERLSLTASSGGSLMQPLFMRYKLMAPDGSTVYCSEPQLLTVAGEFQCCAPVSANFSDDAKRLQQFTLSANVARVFADLPQLDSRDVAEVRIETTPPIHPTDFSSAAETHIQANGNNLILTAYMPGVSAGMVPSEAVRSQMLERVKRAGDSVFGLLERIEAGEAGQRQIQMSSGGTAKEQAVKLRKIIEKTEEVLTEKAATPMRFIACTSCRLGETMVYGDIRLLDSTGIPVSEHPAGIMIRAADERFFSGRITECNLGRIVAIEEMWRNGPTLDASRSFVYLFGTAGIGVATISQTGEIKGVSTIDKRGVTTSRAIARLRGSRHQLAVVADGELIFINGRKVIESSEKLRSLREVAWDTINHELRLLFDDGRQALLDSSLEYLSYLSPQRPAGIFETAKTGVLLSVGDNLYSSRQEVFAIDDRETPKKYKGCLLRIETDTPSRPEAHEWPMRMSRLTVEAYGKAKGTLTVACCNVPSVDEELESLVIKAGVEGWFNVPIGLAVISPPRRYYSVEIDLRREPSLIVGLIETSFIT